MDGPECEEFLYWGPQASVSPIVINPILYMSLNLNPLAGYKMNFGSDINLQQTRLEAF